MLTPMRRGLFFAGLIASVALFGLTGCVQQSEIALASNVYKLDVDARGLIAMDAAKQSLQMRAAELTLSKGYTHYIIADARSAQGVNYLGRTPVYGHTTVNVFGNTTYGQTSLYGGQPILQPYSSTSLVVVMFTAPNIPPNAIDARTIVASRAK